MKKNFIIGVAAIIIAPALFLNSCKKKESSPPSITLIGGSFINQSLPAIAGTAGVWHDPGYIATDPQDGNITPSVVVTYQNGDTVNPNVKGTYIIGYSVVDKEGNPAPALTRTVNIVNDAEIFAGVYATSTDTLFPFNAVDTIKPFPLIITSDSTDNQILIANFGGHDSTSVYRVTANITDTSINVINLPQVVGDSTSISSFISGTIIRAVAPTAIDIKYQWTLGTNTFTNLTHYRR